MSDATIIVTTHDRPTLLEGAVVSAQRQDARIIVIDDGSGAEYARDVCLRLGVESHRLPLNVGYIRARMAALELVDSPYVAFLDDDDRLDHDWLERSRAIEADVVAASFWEVEGDRMRAVVLQPATLSRLLSGHCPVNDGALVRTALLRDPRLWHPERETAAMFSLWLALAAQGASFGAVDTPCWYHHIHGGNMSVGVGGRDAAWRAKAIAEWRAVPA